MTNRISLLLLTLTAGLAINAASVHLAQAKPRAKAKPARKAAPKTTRRAAQAAVPAVFYDTEWSYKVATLYEKKKDIVVGVTGEAKFNRDGTYRQDYYIGSIGNFYKGKYTIAGDRLTTYDEAGKKAFDFRFTVGQNPPVLVLWLENEDGSKSIVYSLKPLEKPAR